MNYMVKIKCNVSNDIFELPSIRNALNSAYVTQGGWIKERYEEIYSYLKEHGLADDDMLEYAHIFDLFKVYVHKAFLNEAVERVFDVERNEFNMVEVLLDLISERKLRSYIYGEPMVRAFAHALRSISPNSSLEAVSYGSKVLLLEKKFLNDRKV